MFPTVLSANQFNSYIQNKDFDKALKFLKNNDIKFSYINSQSESCFDSIYSSTFYHFSILHSHKLVSQEISKIEEIITLLLDKEPHYWFKKSPNMQNEIYYFFNFFLESNNFEKVKFFNDNIKKFNNSDIEKLYMNYRKVTPEIGELIRNSTETTKITQYEISLAYNNFLYDSNNSSSQFINYLKDLTNNKKLRKLTYNHDDLVKFCLLICKNKDFDKIFPELVILYTPELFKNHKPKPSLEENFPLLSKKIDFLSARIFSCMNFDRVIDGIKEVAINKSLTLPLLSYLQEINFKENINDYLVGEFRYKFVPIALEFIIPNDKKDWPSALGLSKEDGFRISSKYFSNFFVHLLSDSLVSKATFSTEEEKITRLKNYRKFYPKQFQDDLLQFEEGLKSLGLTQALNADINNIRLYFKMILAEENNTTQSVKNKKNKI